MLSEKIRWGKFLLEDDNILPVHIVLLYYVLKIKKLHP